MLIIRKNKEMNAVWCEYEEGVEFLIGPLTSIKVLDLRSQCEKSIIVTNAKTKEPEIKDEIDHEKYNDLLIDYLIQDWKGVKDELENDLECILENKKEAMNIPELSEYIIDMGKKLPKLSNKQLEGELGN